MRLKVMVLLAVAALSGGWWPGPTLASEVDPTEAATDGLAVAASGLSLVDASTIQFRAQKEPQALAFDSALHLAFQNREHMGYPWVDLGARTLEVRPIDEMGRRAASLPAAALAAAGLKMLVTLGQASVAELDLIADDVTRLAATGIPDADLIWMTEPDQRDNRVVITISRSSPCHLARAARHRRVKALASPSLRQAELDQGSTPSRLPAAIASSRVRAPRRR